MQFFLSRYHICIIELLNIDNIAGPFRSAYPELNYSLDIASPVFLFLFCTVWYISHYMNNHICIRSYKMYNSSVYPIYTLERTTESYFPCQWCNYLSIYCPIMFLKLYYIFSYLWSFWSVGEERVIGDSVFFLLQACYFRLFVQSILDDTSALCVAKNRSALMLVSPNEQLGGEETWTFFNVSSVIDQLSEAIPIHELWSYTR